MDKGGPPVKGKEEKHINMFIQYSVWSFSRRQSIYKFEREMVRVSVRLYLWAAQQQKRKRQGHKISIKRFFFKKNLGPTMASPKRNSKKLLTFPLVGQKGKYFGWSYKFRYLLHYTTGRGYYKIRKGREVGLFNYNNNKKNLNKK
jgi:hypothetical protein